MEHTEPSPWCRQCERLISFRRKIVEILPLYMWHPHTRRFMIRLGKFKDMHKLFPTREVRVCACIYMVYRNRTLCRTLDESMHTELAMTSDITERSTENNQTGDSDYASTTDFEWM